jgi:hypothetical protein
MERQLAGETDLLGENLPQCYNVHHESHSNQLRSTHMIDDEKWDILLDK